MRKVLVIDDDELLRTSLGMMLNASGCLCALAANALDGIEEAEAGGIDVALIDINMPGVDGFEAVKAIVRIKPRIPIVAMSGRRFGPDTDYAVLSVGLGAHSFLPKPFNRAQLLQAIEDCCGSQIGSQGNTKEMPSRSPRATSTP